MPVYQYENHSGYITGRVIYLVSFSGKFNFLCLLRPHVVDLSFIVICAHQKIKALFCHINFDYATNFVKKMFFLSIFFLLSIKKERKRNTKLNCALNFTLASI